MNWPAVLVLAGGVLVTGLLLLAVLALVERLLRRRQTQAETDLYARPHVRVRVLDRDDWGVNEWQD